MKESTLLNYVEIPKDYRGFIEFIEKNSSLILSDPKLMTRILEELNKRLNDAQYPCELQQDSSMMLATIRFYQEALLKEYNNDITLNRLVDLANSGSLDDYYEIAKTNFLKARFVDKLDFGINRKETVQRIKKKYEVCNESIKMPKILENIEEECFESQAIKNIKTQVENNGKIEYLEMVLDLNSYSQTIYNVFNLALAIRNKAVSLIEEDKKIYVINYVESKEPIEHNIIELTYEKYLKTVETFKNRNI